MKKESFGLKRLNFNTVERYNREAADSRRGFDSFDDLSDEFAMASGNVVSKSTEPYVLTIANANAAATETAVLFGANKYLGQSNFGSGANITITMPASVTYEWLLRQSSIEPFEIVKMRISSDSTSQLNQSMTHYKVDANGSGANTNVTISSYLSPDQFQSTIRDVDQKFTIDGNSYFTYPVLQSTTVVFSIFIQAKVNITKPLLGKDAVSEYSKARIRSFKS